MTRVEIIGNSINPINALRSIFRLTFEKNSIKYITFLFENLGVVEYDAKIKSTILSFEKK